MSEGQRTKNKAAAPLQISAEQILLEAFERREQPLRSKSKKFHDLDELQDYQSRRRKEFEDALTRKRQDIAQWQRYAQFELDQREYNRARSIFERALDVDATNVALWLRYIQSELKERNINHARNLLDRAVAILPRVDKLWFTYVSVEELLSNYAGCRLVYERWMKWNPDEAAWLAYINMEKRYKEYERARELFVRFTSLYPEATNWIKWAKFEEDHGSDVNVRQVYENAVETCMQLGIDNCDEILLIKWTQWETRQHEYERARSIYKLFLEQLPSEKAKRLYNEYTKFEKQYGDNSGIEDVVLSKRRKQYESLLKSSPRDYDLWFSYLKLLEETASPKNQIRELYERAILKVPEGGKDMWRRYIFLWIRYAIFEEFNGETSRANEIYKQCLRLLPHKSFTFAKVWLLNAKFEIRNGNLNEARKILGRGIGLTKKPKIFKGYIEIEKKLKEFDRCRSLYEKYLEAYPESSQIWIEYATLEQDLGDEDRARAIYSLAIEQTEMDVPELVWKNYIDFEIEEGNLDNARKLYDTLLQETSNVKVWISYAMLEMSAVTAEDEGQNQDTDTDYPSGEGSEESIVRARAIFQRAWDDLKSKNLTEQRVTLIDSWSQFETEFGTAESNAKVEKMKPTMVKKRRKLDDGTIEEYDDYLFPTDGSNKMSKLLENARKWKESKKAN